MYNKILWDVYAHCPRCPQTIRNRSRATAAVRALHNINIVYAAYTVAYVYIPLYYAVVAVYHNIMTSPPPTCIAARPPTAQIPI